MILNNLYKFKFLTVFISVIFLIAFFILFQSLFSLKEYSNNIINKSIEIAHLEKKKELENYVTLAYKTIQSYHARTAEDKIKNEVKKYIDEQSNYLFSIIEGVYEDNKEKLSEEELKNKIISIVKNARYGKSGYFWINSFDYKMIMHPIKKELTGNYFNNNKEVPFIKLGVDKLKEKKSNLEYIEYSFYNPTSKKTVFKSSLVKVFKPFNWIIGTGSYIDDVSEEMKASALKTISQMKYGKNGYFWVINSKHELLVHNDKLFFQNNNKFNEKNKKGVYVYQEVVKTAITQEEGGFLKYFWIKPDSKVEFEKLSFVKKFEAWDYIIGTGVYIDEIEKNNTLISENKNEVVLYVVQIIVLFSMMVILIIVLLKNIKKQKNIESKLKIKTNELDFLNKNLEDKISIRTHEIENQKHVLQKIMDSDLNMSVVTDFKNISFMNETFLNFFGLKNQKEFLNRFSNFIDVFCEFGDYLHKGKLNKKTDENSLANEFYNLVKNTSEDKRIVVLLNMSLEAKSFYINMTLLDENKNLFLISLTDITKLTIQKNLTEKKAYYDELTKVPNRNSFNEQFEKEIEIVKRYKSPLSLAILDVDHFKKFNDNYGHLIGDEVLIMIAKECKRKIRKTDFFARWGGEEFVLLLPHTDINKAFESCEKLRIAIQDLKHNTAGGITCSIGITQFSLDDDIKTIFKRCDEALYRAKANGRNRVEFI